MDLDKVKKLLDKYDVNSLEELEYYLDIDNAKNECSQDPKTKDKNCLNANCYEDTKVPDCRKIIEIYNKYFKIDIGSKKAFIAYLSKHTNKSTSSIANYLSCKSCNKQMSQSIYNSLKIADNEFKKDFCFNLDKKFNYQTLFDTEYLSLKPFLLKDHEVTQKTFKPSYQEDNDMCTEEENKLFNLTQVSKKELKANLSNKNNLEGSTGYRMNLALVSFSRNLFDECEKILTLLSSEVNFKENEMFLQLKAKVLSAQGRDKDAISILHTLIEDTQPKIHTEANNLLAASIKREALNTFSLYGDEKKLSRSLAEAKDIYHTVFKLNNDYYPALNYMYLEAIGKYIDNANKSTVQIMQSEFKNIWASIDFKIDDWWSYIASVEYLILQEEYKEALAQLNQHFDSIDSFEINDFNLMSTIRQLEFFSRFCTHTGLGDIIVLLKSHLPQT